MKKALGLILVMVISFSLTVSPVVASSQRTIKWSDPKDFPRIIEENIKSSSANFNIRPIVLKSQPQKEAFQPLPLPSFIPVEPVLTANVLESTIKFLRPNNKVTPAPTPTTKPILVPSPASSPVANPIASPKFLSNNSATYTRADVAKDIRDALTRALGAAPYSDGNSYPYHPVYEQIANQSYSTGLSTGRAIQVVQNTITNSSSLSSLDDVSGTLGVANGGTGITTAPTYGKLLVGNSSGGYDLIATSSLGIQATGFNGTTDDIAQGTTNKFYNDSLVIPFLDASSTVPKTYSSNTFTNSNIFSGAVTIGSLNGPLQANGGVVSATTSVGVTYGGTGATSFGQGWIYSSGGTVTLTSSTSPTVAFIVATSSTASILPYASSTAITATTLFGTSLNASGLATLGNILATGSSTLQNFTGLNATTTNATTTSLRVSGPTSLGSLSGVLKAASGLVSVGVDGTDFSLIDAVTCTNQTVTALTAAGVGTCSSINNAYWSGTDLAVTNGGTGLSTFGGTNTILYTTAADTLSSEAAFAYNATTDNLAFLFASSTAISASSLIQSANILATGSSTLQNFTAGNSTSTNATSTSSFATNASSTRLFSTTAQFGTASFGKLTNLATNGFVKTSGSDGTLSVDTSTYLLTTSVDFIRQTNYNVLSMTASSSVAFWVKDQFFASSSAVVAGSMTANNYVATGTAASLFPTIGISSTTPSSNLSVNGTAWLDLATLRLASTTATGLIVNYLASTTNLAALTQGSWAIASSTATGGNPVMNVAFSSTGATSTVGFFVSTSTGLIAGTGLGLPSALKNYVIVGSGNVQAGMAIVKGGLCVDSDGWCTASTTGVISTSGGVQTANADLAEIYYSHDSLEPGDLVTMGNPATYVEKAQIGGTSVIGVVSTKPGLVLGLGPDQESSTPSYPIALAGRVPIKVHGSVSTGDFLTISDEAGVAVKALDGSQVIAQALESYSGTGIGKIMAIIKSTYYKTSDDSKFTELKDSVISVESKIDALEKDLEKLQFTTTAALRSDVVLSGTTTMSGGLTLVGKAVFLGGLTVESIGSAGASLQLLSDATFFGRPYFTTDTVGSALIRERGRTVDITFERDYTDAPEVTATLSLLKNSLSAAVENAVFDQDIRFIVTNRTSHGFTISLNKPAPFDLTFSWIALAAKNTRLFSSAVISEQAPAPITTPSPSPTITPEPSPASETTTEVTTPTEEEVTPSPSPEASVAPVVEETTPPAAEPVEAPVAEPVTTE